MKNQQEEGKDCKLSDLRDLRGTQMKTQKHERMEEIKRSESHRPASQQTT